MGVRLWLRVSLVPLCQPGAAWADNGQHSPTFLPSSTLCSDNGDLLWDPITAHHQHHSPAQGGKPGSKFPLNAQKMRQVSHPFILILCSLSHTELCRLHCTNKAKRFQDWFRSFPSPLQTSCIAGGYYQNKTFWMTPGQGQSIPKQDLCQFNFHSLVTKQHAEKLLKTIFILLYSVLSWVILSLLQLLYWVLSFCLEAGVCVHFKFRECPMYL